MAWEAAQRSFRRAFDAVAGSSDELAALLGKERRWHEHGGTRGLDSLRAYGGAITHAVDMAANGNAHEQVLAQVRVSRDDPVALFAVVGELQPLGLKKTERDQLLALIARAIAERVEANHTLDVACLDPPCPRCQQPMPCRPGALSRADHTTIICPTCGSKEAIRAVLGLEQLRPEAWPVRWPETLDQAQTELGGSVHCTVPASAATTTAGGLWVPGGLKSRKRS